MKQFFYILLIFSFVVGQLIRFDIFGVQFPLLDTAVFLFLAYHVLSKRFSWKKYFEQKWLLVFIGALILSNIVNVFRYSLTENVTGNLYLVRFVIYSLIIGINLNGQVRRPVPTIKIINIIGVTIAMIGIFQFIFLPDLRFLQYQNWDDHLNRLTFPYLDPSFTGAILLVFLMNLCGQTSPPAGEVGWSVPTKIFIIVEAVAIFLTFSRATWMTGGVLLSMIVLEKRRVRGIGKIRGIRVVGGILLIGVIICIFFWKSGSYGNQLLRTETILSRTSSLQKGLQIWQKNPIFGVGFNNYKTYQLQNGYEVKNGLENRGEASVENSYIFVLATSGIVGLFAFLGWTMGTLRKLGRVRKYIFAAILILSLFNNILFYPFVLLIIFLIIRGNLGEHNGI